MGLSRNFWSRVIFGPGRTKITAFLVRCHRKLCRQEIVSQRQDFLGKNVAPAKHVFPTPGNFVAVCVARIYCLLNMQVPMRTAT